MNFQMQSSAIKIGSRTFAIALLDDRTFDQILSRRTNEPEPVKSFIDYDDQLICVREKLKYDHKRELILHEILHACLDDSGIDDDDNERLISILAPRLIGLVDNLPIILDELT